MCIRELSASGYNIKQISLSVGIPYNTFSLMHSRDQHGIKTIIEHGRIEYDALKNDKAGYCVGCDDNYTHPDDLKSIAIYNRCWTCRHKQVRPELYPGGIRRND